MAKRNNKVLITSAVATLTSLMLLAPMAVADELEDKKLQLEQSINQDTSTLEFLNKDILEAEQELKNLQSKIPSLREAYTVANMDVNNSEKAIQELTTRINNAEDERFAIEQEIVNNAVKVQKIEDDMGRIANDMYKNGSSSSNTINLLLNSKDLTNIGDQIIMVNAVNRTNNAVIESYKERESIANNNQLRLSAIRDSISQDKIIQEELLSKQLIIREESQKRKNDLDQAVQGAEKLSSQLMNKRPAIQASLKQASTDRDNVVREIAIKQERELREAREKAAREEAARQAAIKEAREKEAARQAAHKKAEAERQEAHRKAEAKRKAEAESNKKPYVPKPKPKPNPKPKPDTKPPVYVPPSSNNGHKGFNLIRPVSGGYISSGYGWRPTPPGTIDYGGAGGYVHAGMDFAVGCGTPIKAAASGTIWESGFGGGAGNYVMMSHGVSNGNALVTRYHHMIRTAVYAGQKVSQGQTIGYVGSTGNSTGCHLHLETILNGNRTNPAPWY